MVEMQVCSQLVFNRQVLPGNELVQFFTFCRIKTSGIDYGTFETLLIPDHIGIDRYHVERKLHDFHRCSDIRVERKPLFWFRNILL